MKKIWFYRRQISLFIAKQFFLNVNLTKLTEVYAQNKEKCHLDEKM